MNGTERDSRSWLNSTIGEYRILDIIVGVAIVMMIAFLAFCITLSVKKAVKSSANTGPPVAVTSVKLGETSHPQDLETSGNWATGSIHLSDFVDDELFRGPVDDSSIVSSLTYQGTPRNLNAPVLSHRSGYYPESQFPINLLLTNPNDLSTWLMISLNGGPFNKFEGQSLVIKPGDTVEAYVRGETQRWNESGIVRGRYRSKAYDTFPSSKD